MWGYAKISGEDRPDILPSKCGGIFKGKDLCQETASNIAPVTCLGLFVMGNSLVPVSRMKSWKRDGRRA